LVALYVTSLDEAVGKTVVGAGLGKHLLGNGKKVGFLKPLIAETEGPPVEGVDSDAEFMKHVLALEEPVEALCPVISDTEDLASEIKKVYAGVSKGKDVVIMEGTGKPSPALFKVADALGAKVVIVEGYSDGLLTARLTSSGEDWGGHLLGAVLNKVPGSQLDRVSGEISEPGINILGVLPEDRTLLALSVGELAEHVQGEILNNAEMSGALVENIMLGAMTVDPGPDYFGRKANKAVIVRGERPDMQLAALETPTTCLVISGDTAPIPSVRYNAEHKKVPIILTRGDVLATVTSIESALGKARFNQESKLARLTEIMNQHFDFPAVYKGLGLTK